MIKSRKLGWAGHVARMEESRSVFKILTGKPTGKRPLGRSKRRWEDNIRMNLEERGINAGNWVDSAQDRDYWRGLVNAVLNFRVSLTMELFVIAFYWVLFMLDGFRFHLLTEMFPSPGNEPASHPIILVLKASCLKPRGYRT